MDGKQTISLSDWILARISFVLLPLARAHEYLSLATKTFLKISALK